MSPKIGYPKPLPTHTNENFMLESGFTPTEIVALQNGWRLIKRSLYYHSAKIAVEFFSENYFLLSRFREEKTEKFNVSSLHQHTQRTMNFYGRLIEGGLNDLTFINMLLSEVGNKHKLYGVTYDHVKLISDYIKRYLIERLEKIKSTTFLNGLEKLSELITQQHREKTESCDNTLEERTE